MLNLNTELKFSQLEVSFLVVLFTIYSNRKSGNSEQEKIEYFTLLNNSGDPLKKIKNKPQKD